MTETPQRCVLGKVCLLLLGKLCLVAHSRARQVQVIQRLLFLAFLLQLISVTLPLSKFAEDLTVLACGLINTELSKTLRFELLKAHAQLIRRPLEFQLAFSNFHEMSGGQLEGQIFFPLFSYAHLFRINLLQLVFSLDDLPHNEKQGGLFGMFYALAKAQHRIESKTECHI